MGHPYRIREIASQAGLSEATVDRVLHGRGGVRSSTVDEVRRAIADLDRQRAQVRLSGRTFVIDVVMQAPERFSAAVRAAIEAELPLLRPAVFRSRFHFRETGTAADVASVLRRVRARGSAGVLVKAPDTPEVAEQIAELAARGIPVLTLVTDLPASRRLAYIGIDNRAAGATAAYLVRQWLGERPGDVLVTLSRSVFRGEEEREMGFRAAMRAHASAAHAWPPRAIVEIADTEGLDEVMFRLATSALEANPGIRAVYSVGGGNRSIVRAFAELGRSCEVFVAHDLDADNRALLQDGQLSVVLDHDLRVDVRNAFHAILRAHDAVTGPLVPPPSQIQVITPFNLPGSSP